MTREELKEHCKKQIENCEMWARYKGEEPHGKVYEEHKLILELLEQEPTTKNDLGVDCISRREVLRLLANNIGKSNTYLQTEVLRMLSVTPQEPIKGHCKDCKWWKDKDRVYRRGINAESKCPINRREVMEGKGYCFLFEPHESEDKE